MFLECVFVVGIIQLINLRIKSSCRLVRGGSRLSILRYKTSRRAELRSGLMPDQGMVVITLCCRKFQIVLLLDSDVLSHYRPCRRSWSSGGDTNMFYNDITPVPVTRFPCAATMFRLHHGNSTPCFDPSSIKWDCGVMLPVVIRSLQTQILRSVTRKLSTAFIHPVSMSLVTNRVSPNTMPSDSGDKCPSV